MARVKRAVAAKKHRRVILEKAQGYYGNKSRSYRAANDQVMHIPDWTTFVAHRFFYDASSPMQRVVTVSQSSLDCYRIIEGNRAWIQSKLIVCN